MTAFTLAANATKVRPTVPKRDTYGHGPERGIPMCIYTITHRATGRVYVGQSIHAAGRRWLNHMYEHGQKNSRIKRALRKYGHGEFTFSVIDIAESQEQLDHKEQFWIKQLDCLTPKGFNLCSGGRGGNKLHPESIEKMKATKRAKRPDGYVPMGINAVRRRRTPEEKAQAIAAGNASRRGKPTWLSTHGLTKEQRERMRQAKIGKPVPKKYKAVCGSDGSEYVSLQAAIAVHGVSIADVVRGRRNSLFGVKYWYKGEQS